MAMAKKKGVHCGRPRILSAKVVDNIKRQRAQGRTLQAIASALTDKGIQTAHKGSQWYPSTGCEYCTALRGLLGDSTALSGRLARVMSLRHVDVVRSGREGNDVQDAASRPWVPSR